MENARGLPIAAYRGRRSSLAIAIAPLLPGSRDRRHLPPQRVEIGLVAAAVGLLIFGVQGLVSVLVEGQRLRPGRVPSAPDRPAQRSAIVVFSLVLFAGAIAPRLRHLRRLGPGGHRLCWPAPAAWSLALLLIFYKEAFVGDEASFDDREDGVPW